MNKQNSINTRKNIYKFNLQLIMQSMYKLALYEN